MEGGAPDSEGPVAEHMSKKLPVTGGAALFPSCQGEVSMLLPILGISSEKEMAGSSTFFLNEEIPRPGSSMASSPWHYGNRTAPAVTGSFFAMCSATGPSESGAPPSIDDDSSTKSHVRNPKMEQPPKPRRKNL
jgi:hypothetical protein